MPELMQDRACDIKPRAVEISQDITVYNWPERVSFNDL
jgi:hypothetical protein